MMYFNKVETLEELRRQYKELLKKYHPDNPEGSTKATQEINAEYDRLFNLLKDKYNTFSSHTEYENRKYDFAEYEKLREVLQQIVGLIGVNIEIIGCWIWVDGNSYSHRKNLKELGFKWASEKRKWYFHTEAFRKKSRRRLTIDDIRNYYGSTEVKVEGFRQLQQA